MDIKLLAGGRWRVGVHVAVLFQMRQQRVRATLKALRHVCVFLVPRTFFQSLRDDDDDDTQRSPSNSRQRPGLTGVSVGVIAPRKNMLQLMWLALLARFALARSKMTVCSTSGLDEKNITES